MQLPERGTKRCRDDANLVTDDDRMSIDLTTPTASAFSEEREEKDQGLYKRENGQTWH